MEASISDFSFGSGSEIEGDIRFLGVETTSFAVGSKLVKYPNIANLIKVVHIFEGRVVNSPTHLSWIPCLDCRSWYDINTG